MGKFKNIFNLSLKGRDILWGIIFISPFIIGFLLFFLYPFIQSIIFSLSKLEVHSDGFNLNFVGTGNYHHILMVDPNFIRTFVYSILETLANLPAIIMFSFFAATLLNQEFKGRMLARIIFFLPVIMTSGIILRLESEDYLHNVMAGIESSEAGGSMLSGAAVRSLLFELKLPQGFIEYIISVVGQIPNIINASAIPILIFLAGLQSIPQSLYEAADMEGATGWERFWKITFPMVTPLILTNVVYIIIDSFTSYHNDLVIFIREAAFGGSGYGISSAMAWLYFGAIIIILLIIYKIISGRVFYYE
ncbi:MAG: carbohydrate ABC transporter permease [Halanaerobiales bacterium]